MCNKNQLIVLLIGFCVLPVFFGCGSSPAPQEASGQSRVNAPGWTSDPYTRFNRNANVAAVGMGSTRELAESNAFANLIAIFGQSIELDETVSSSYEQAARNGVIAGWSETVGVDTSIQRLARIDSLVGAEIGETWYDGRNEYYAAAVLNRARAAQIYGDLISSNQAIIENLIDIPPEERGSFEEITRYHLAALIADMLAPYGNLLSVIGAPLQGLRSGDEYRLEAANIARTIPIGLRVQNDRSGRIQSAFSRALADVGFQSGGTGSRYLLDVDIGTAPVIISGNPNSWTRIEVNADLRDNSLGTVLLPFNFNSREGHTSQMEADNRAYIAAERRINSEYAGLLNDYLSQLLPENR